MTYKLFEEVVLTKDIPEKGLKKVTLRLLLNTILFLAVNTVIL